MCLDSDRVFRIEGLETGIMWSFFTQDVNINLSTGLTGGIQVAFFTLSQSIQLFTHSIQ